jgi:hypothetical protein
MENFHCASRKLSEFPERRENGMGRNLEGHRRLRDVGREGGDVGREGRNEKGGGRACTAAREQKEKKKKKKKRKNKKEKKKEKGKTNSGDIRHPMAIIKLARPLRVHRGIHPYGSSLLAGLFASTFSGTSPTGRRGERARGKRTLWPIAGLASAGRVRDWIPSTSPTGASDSYICGWCYPAFPSSLFV